MIGSAESVRLVSLSRLLQKLHFGAGVLSLLVSLATAVRDGSITTTNSEILPITGVGFIVTDVIVWVIGQFTRVLSSGVEKISIGHFIEKQHLQK